MTEPIITPADINANLRAIIVIMMLFNVVLIGLVILFAYRLAGLVRRVGQLEQELELAQILHEESHVLTQAEMLADDRPIPAVRPKDSHDADDASSSGPPAPPATEDPRSLKP